MICSNSDILALIDYFENGTDLSNNNWDNYNYYDLWNALENGASPPSRPVCGTFSQADILSVTLGVLGTLTTPSEYLGTNRDFYYLYLKAIGSEDPSPTFDNYCVYELYQVFSVGSFAYLLDDVTGGILGLSNRRLYSSGNPFLNEVRRSSDNSLDDFFAANNEFSLNSLSSLGATLTAFAGANDGFQRTWYDQSATGFDGVQTTVSDQPKLLSSGVLETLNGKSAVNFNGGLFLEFSDVFEGGLIPSKQSFCLMVIGDFTNDGSFKNTLCCADTTADRFIVRQQNTGQIFVALGNNTHTSTMVLNSANDGIIVNLTLTGGLYDLDVIKISDGTTESFNGVSVSGDWGTLSNSFVGCTFSVNNFSGSGSGFNGGVNEVVLWDNDKTSDITSIRNNVKSFYAI